MKDITARAGELLSELPLPEILRDMKDLVASRPQLARQLNTVLLKRLAIGDNRAWISTIIFTCWDKAEDQCVLLLEYDYLMEGFQTALAAKQQHFVSLVAYKASLVGNLDLVRSCEKLLG
jgi:predicted phosphohydrolase